MKSLEGANCGDLPGFVIDKYFYCKANTEPLRAMVGRAICQRCVVLELCREDALNGALPQPHGIIAGVSAGEMKRARAWRRYEQGIVDKVPRSPRPEWLGRPEATEIVEQMRLEIDPDEPAP